MYTYVTLLLEAVHISSKHSIMWMISTCHFILKSKNKLLLSSKAILAMVVGWKDINLSLSDVAAVLGLSEQIEI